MLTTSPDRGAIYSPFIEGGSIWIGRRGCQAHSGGFARNVPVTESPPSSRVWPTQRGPAIRCPFPAAHRGVVAKPLSKNNLTGEIPGTALGAVTKLQIADQVIS